MKCQIIGRGITVTPAMKEAASKKLSMRMDRYFDNDADVKCVVTFSVGHHDQTVEIAISTKNVDLRAKVVADDAYSAVDLCIDKLEGQMRKMKTQLSKVHKKAGLAENILMDLVEDEEDELRTVVKRKKLSLVPIDQEEAIFRMEALDHEFFVYLDSDTGLVSIIYRRSDGDYGLIEIDE